MFSYGHWICTCGGYVDTLVNSYLNLQMMSVVIFVATCPISRLPLQIYVLPLSGVKDMFLREIFMLCLCTDRKPCRPDVIL